MSDLVKQLEQRNAELEQKVAELTHNLESKEEQLQDSLSELHRLKNHMVQMEKMTMLGQMISGISHEINNPINFIYGNLPYVDEHVEDLCSVIEAFQDAYPNPEESVEDTIEEVELDYILEDLPRIMGSMKVGAERIRDLVLTLRHFYRLDEPDMKEASLEEGLENTLVLLNNRTKQNVEVEREFAGIPKVECYINQLNQVFMNLLNNAIDALLEEAENASAKRGEKNKITVKTEKVDDNAIAIHISDNGPGIAPDIQSRIFEPFFTTKPMGVGTGLGLSISHKIITETHHGEMTFSSTPGEGSTFTVKLPLSQPKDAQNSCSQGSQSKQSAVV
jgi:signal transduction histidine kinase